MITNLLIRLFMSWVRIRHWRPFMAKTYFPQGTQIDLLHRILSRNASTSFGTEHRFKDIRTYEEYRANVPVQSYEDLRPCIMKQADTGSAELTVEQPVFYTQTSGTTDRPKLVPITPSAVREYKASQRLFSYSLYASQPSIYSGKVLAIVSPAIEGTLTSGIPFGSMSGLNYSDMPAIVRRKYVVPKEVFAIEEYDAKYERIAALAVAERDVTLLASPNPSTFMRLLDVINTGKQDGRTFADLWPGLKAVVTWTGGSAGLRIGELKKLIPAETAIIEMGYLSSEFRGTITLPHEQNVGIPTFHETFFEFVNVDVRDAGKDAFLLLHELVVGKLYYVFVTTSSGLYRYDINDIIEVTGRYHATPTIRFVQKGKGVTNITGEKLYESQVGLALTRVADEIGTSFPFYVMIADEEASQYVLYLEHMPVTSLDADLEHRLEETNIEYATKVRSGRLHPVVVMYLKPGTSEAYKRQKMRTGQRESQYKIVTLQYKRECDFDFDGHAIA